MSSGDERKTGFTIVLRPLVQTTVSGHVTFDDTRPVTEAWVTAAPVDHRWTGMHRVKADGAGAFRLRVLTGLAYAIGAPGSQS